ncbi:hypothetical protein AX14_012972 [Amanita brunnescens Koide BX004]|nr:hypothetical protein AX14_012972 [Amanita brunnescens Koide BX004]
MPFFEELPCGNPFLWFLEHSQLRGSIETCPLLRAIAKCVHTFLCCCFVVSTFRRMRRKVQLIRTFHIRQPLLLLRGRLTVQLISTHLYKLVYNT